MARLPRVLRFLLSGGFNTAASYGVYLLLLQGLGHRWAYVASFVFGMVLSFVLLRWLVFQNAGRQHAWVWVALTNLGQMLLGLGVVEVWVRVLNGPPALAALAAVALGVPLSYVAHRWVFRRPKSTP